MALFRNVRIENMTAYLRPWPGIGKRSRNEMRARHVKCRLLSIGNRPIETAKKVFSGITSKNSTVLCFVAAMRG